jgi:DNA-binding XRE family transcriptional regulator
VSEPSERTELLKKSEETTVNEEKQKPVNDDPRRLHEDNVECYTACDDIEGEDSDFEDEDVALTLLASMSMFETTIEGKNPEEVKHEFVKFYRRMRFAEGILDRHLLEKEAESTKPKITGTFAEQVAIHMAANIWATYTERLDDKNVWNKDVFDRFNERLKVMVIDWLTELPDQHENLQNMLWKYAIAWAAEQMEEDHGSKVLEAMSDKEFSNLLREYLFIKQDFEEATASMISGYAQNMARIFVEVIDPASMSLDALEDFIGFQHKSGTAHITGRATVTIDGEKHKTLEAADIFDRMLSVPSAAPYSVLQEIVATRDFHEEKGTPWPVAWINKRGARGTAQLRPAGMDEQPFMAPNEVEAWSKIMWRYREQMTALDVDVMDALAAIYLQQTRNPDESAAADVDGLLSMRGLKPKLGGHGRRGGYMPEQRREIMAALARIQSIWLDIAEMDVYEEGPKGGRKRSRKTVQSRPFVITDRMGQTRLDGYMNVERFIFKPGAVFAHYLHGPGRQTALLNAKILELDPYREAWEKAIGRYLTNLWRIRAQSGTYSDPLRVQTLLERTGRKLTPRHGTWIRDRFEKALDTLTEHGIINSWQYDRWNEDVTQRRGWFKEWLQATVIIEPADEIEEHYRDIEQPGKAMPKRMKAPKNEGLGPWMKARRKQLRLTQMQAAEELGITQAYFSQIERRKTKPGPALEKKIREWLGDSI